MSMPPIPPGGGPQFGQAPSGREAQKSNRRGWIVGGTSIAAVLALVVGLLIWQGGSDGDEGPVADDGLDRTVGLLTEKDPVCDDWIRYADELAANSAMEQWSGVAKATPARDWDMEQRRVFENAAHVMRGAADRFEVMLPLAGHVVLRELIAQAIVHWRLYVDALRDYREQDAALARVARNFGGAVTYMCTAVPIVQPITGIPTRNSSVADDPGELEPVSVAEDPVCLDFLAFVDQQNSVLAGWFASDPTLPAVNWTSEQRQLNLAANAVLARDVEKTRDWSAEAHSPAFADLLFTYSAYLEAFLAKLATYEPDDNQMWRTATLIGGGIAALCEAQ